MPTKTEGSNLPCISKANFSTVSTYSLKLIINFLDIESVSINILFKKGEL